MPSPTKSPSDKKSQKVALKAPPEKPATPARKTAAPAPKAKKISQTATMTTAEERHRLIAEAAYLRAEQRGFQGGSPEQDWFDAAAQVDQLFMKQE